MNGLVVRVIQCVKEVQILILTGYIKMYSFNYLYMRKGTFALNANEAYFGSSRLGFFFVDFFLVFGGILWDSFCARVHSSSTSSFAWGLLRFLFSSTLLRLGAASYHTSVVMWCAHGKKSIKL